VLANPVSPALKKNVLAHQARRNLEGRKADRVRVDIVGSIWVVIRVAAECQQVPLVGCGAGSLAKWFADRVAPTGRVLAIDLDPRFFAGSRPSQSGGAPTGRRE